MTYKNRLIPDAECIRKNKNNGKYHTFNHSTIN